MTRTGPLHFVEACLFCLTLASSTSALAHDARHAERFTHVAGIRLADEHSLDDIQKRFGKARVVETGDAAAYDARLCYRTVQADTVVEFFHGEVDWGFVVRRATDRDTACPASAQLDDANLSVAGIQPGMTKSVYERLVGSFETPSRDHLKSHFHYVHVLTDKELARLLQRDAAHGSMQTNPEDVRRWDVDIYIDATFKRDRLESFTVDRIEVN